MNEFVSLLKEYLILKTVGEVVIFLIGIILIYFLYKYFNRQASQKEKEYQEKVKRMHEEHEAEVKKMHDWAERNGVGIDLDEDHQDDTKK